MRKCILFLLTALLSFSFLNAADSVWTTKIEDYFNPDAGNEKSIELTKNVNFKLGGQNGQKERVRIGFTDHDISLSENGSGAFPDFTTIDQIDLEVDLDSSSESYGNAVVDDGFYISYQFVSDNDISVYLHTEEKMKGKKNSDVVIDFKVFRTQSNGDDIIFVNTEDETGLGNYETNNDVYSHSSDDRYAWGDGIMLHVEAIPVLSETTTTSSKGFLALHADEFTAKLIATCVVNS